MYRIYLVEDDVIIARSIKKHLENWEYEVQCTKDFSAVTKEFAEFAPQLVLMDILHTPYQSPLIFQVHLLSSLLLHQLSYL